MIVSSKSHYRNAAAINSRHRRRGNGKVTRQHRPEGKPETAWSDNAGQDRRCEIEDKNKISVVDIRKKAFITSYPLGA